MQQAGKRGKVLHHLPYRRCISAVALQCAELIGSLVVTVNSQPLCTTSSLLQLHKRRSLINAPQPYQRNPQPFFGRWSTSHRQWSPARILEIWILWARAKADVRVPSSSFTSGRTRAKTRYRKKLITQSIRFLSTSKGMLLPCPIPGTWTYSTGRPASFISDTNRSECFSLLTAVSLSPWIIR